MPHKGRKVIVAVLSRTPCLGDFAIALKRIAERLCIHAPTTGGGLLACNETDRNIVTDADVSMQADLIADPELLTIAANETAEQMIAPYGEYPVSAILPDGTRIQKIQVFDQQAANEMVTHYNGVLAKLKRTITGALGMGTAEVPGYYRHPDANPDHVDGRVYLEASKLRAGEDGLYGNLSYNEFGTRLLEEVKGLRISPTWYMRPMRRGNNADGVGYARPYKLKSLGLTQFPNIPTAVGVNEKPKTKNIMKPELLKALLTLLAFNESRIQATIDGGPDAVSISEVNSAFAPFTTAANEAKKIPDLTKQISDLTASEKTATDGLKAANEKVLEFSTTLATNEVEVAIAAGKIKPVEKDSRIKTLVEAEDFAVACNELNAIEDGKAVKTKSVTDGLAKEQSDGLIAINEANEKFTALVAANQASGMGYDAAWTAAEQSAEGQKLQAIIKPEAGE